MKQKKKREYKKPRLTQIRLDAECAVLGFCKTSGKTGPGVPGCNPGVPCSGDGS